MKRWMTLKGEKEIPFIYRDIKKMLASDKAEHYLMLIFSTNKIADTDHQLGWLAKRLGLAQSEDSSVWEGKYIFQTIDRNGGEVEFWVAGYEVNNNSNHSPRM